MSCFVAVSQETSSELAATSVSIEVSSALGGTGCDLAFVFFSPHYSSTISDIIQRIHQQLGPKTLVGCMGAGIIGGKEEIEEEPALVLWGIQHSGMEVVPFSLTPKREGESLTLQGWPQSLQSSASSYTLLMFADPFSTPIDELFSMLDQHVPGSPAIGGIATGGMEEGDIQLVLNTDVISAGVVGVAIKGGMQVRTVVSQGCQPIGERFVVTKVNRNVIQELGGIPPLERLESTLEILDERQRQQAARGLQVGIAMNEHQEDFKKGDFLIRGLLGADRQSGSLAIADFVKEGQTLQFHIRDAQTASDDFNGLLAIERMMAPNQKPQGALLFSCNGRGAGFFQSPHHDVGTVRRQMGAIPVAGFFAGGEIGPVGGKNYLHGYTASMALFYEEESSTST